MSELAQRHRWTVDEYYKLIDAGIFDENDRIELIEGDLIEMAPIGDRHAGKVNRLSNALTGKLDQKVIVATQNPIKLGTHSDPQPDIVLLRWDKNYYETRRPTQEDVLLIIEVSDSTLRYDQEVKIPLYARFDIPEAWIINIPKQRLDVYRDPRDGNYTTVTHHQSGYLSPVNLPTVRIDVTDLFPASTTKDG